MTDTADDQTAARPVVGQAEAILRSLFDAIPVALYVFRRVENDFVLIDFNPAGELFAGVDLTERVGMKVSDLFPETPQVVKSLSHCFAKQTTLEREVELGREARGEALWLALKYVFVPPDIVLVHAEGITLRKRAEEALHQQGARLRALFNAPMDTIAILDRDGTLLDINENGAKRLGGTVAALIGENVYKRFPGPVAASRRSYIDGVFETCQPVSFEDERAGLTLLNRVYPILGKGGRVAQVAIFATDISERLRSEAALKESQALQQLALEGGRLGVWANDLVSGETFWDPRTREIFGVGPDEVISLEKGLSIIHPDDRPRTLEALEQATQPDSGGHYEVEKRVLHPDGSVRWVATKGQVSFQGKGATRRATRLVGVVTDITPRRVAEEQLRYQAELLQHVSEAIIATDLDFTIQSWNQAAQRMYGYRADEVIGKPVRTVLQTSFPEGSGKDVEKSFHEKGHWRGDVIQYDKEGTPLHVHSSVSAVRDSGGHQIGAVAINRNITRRKQAEAEQERLNQELQNQAAELERRVADRTRELSALYDIAAIAGQNLELSTMLERILACTLESMECAKGAIHLVEETDVTPDGGALKVAVHQGFAPQIHEQGVLRNDRSGLLDRVWRQGETVNAPAALADGPAGVGPYLVIPLQTAGQRMGVLGLAREPGQPPFDAEDEALLTSIGRQTAQAVENARLRAEAAEAAVTAERNRLAGELHDAVTQVLFSTSLIAETLPQRWARQPEEGQQALADLRRLTQGALAEMRALLLELRPAALVEQDLEGLIQQLVRGMMARTRMPVTTTLVGDGSLPVEVKLAVYRIAQEALNNVTKHAQASRARVYLQYEPEQVTLHVTDDGIGFDPQQVAAKSLGLNIMRERAAAVGANFSLETAPGQGTEITVEWREQA